MCICTCCSIRTSSVIISKTQFPSTRGCLLSPTWFQILKLNLSFWYVYSRKSFLQEVPKTPSLLIPKPRQKHGNVKKKTTSFEASIFHRYKVFLLWSYTELFLEPFSFVCDTLCFGFLHFCCCCCCFFIMLWAIRASLLKMVVKMRRKRRREKKLLVHSGRHGSWDQMSSNKTQGQGEWVPSRRK